MVSHYACLGIEKNASEEKITATYKQLIAANPDEESKKWIEEAYRILSDDERRNLYDINCSGVDELQSDPNYWDHYQYLNQLFYFEGSQELITGQCLKEPEALYHLISKTEPSIQEYRMWLEEKYRAHPSEAIAERIALVKANEKKLEIVGRVICLSVFKKAKMLYDLSLGIIHAEETYDDLKMPYIITAEEMREIKDNIGLDNLIEHIKEHPGIESAGAIFALNKAGLLTLANLKQLTQCKSRDLPHISDMIEDLLTHQLLTQENFDLFMENKEHAASVSCSVDKLAKRKILNQAFFEQLIQSGKDAGYISAVIEKLKIFGLLTEENCALIFEKISDPKSLYDPLEDLNTKRFFNYFNASILSWQVPEKLTQFNQNIETMFFYGLNLLPKDLKKGENLIRIALELKYQLKVFSDQSVNKKIESQENYNDQLIKTLHSKDKIIAYHHFKWSIAIANVVIGCTVLGLVAIFINYCLTGHLLFEKKYEEEKLIDLVEKDIKTLSFETDNSNPNFTNPNILVSNSNLSVEKSMREYRKQNAKLPYQYNPAQENQEDNDEDNDQLLEFKIR